jgi:surface polysaccharide O-acyltransferase-like enzyme
MDKNTSTPQFSRDYNLDILRILAAFFVIVVHTAGTGLMPGRSYELGTFNWYICLVISSLARWCVPVFVMISGAVFLKPTKRTSIKTLFSKYILRIAIALIVWSLFYSLYFHNPILPLGTGTGNHLWYLSMIIGIYLTIPILQNLPDNLLNYFIFIWMFFLTYDFLNKMTGNYFILGDLEYNFFLGYIGYFILGHLLYNKQRTKLTNMLIYWAGILSTLMTIFGAIWLSIQGGETNQKFFNYFSPNVLMMSIALFVFITNRKSQIQNQRVRELIYSLSSASFGIYLVHMFVLIQLYSRIVRFVPNPLFFIPLVCLVTFGVSYFIVLIVKRLPIVSNYIV